MIRINRGPEPKELVRTRPRELRKLRTLAGSRPPTGDDITGYQTAGDLLWRAQHYKCCYCEQKIKKQYNDVEHYRPKARATRVPGCTETHGYWWLAFSWANLLFACPSCNRSEKNDRFPLTAGSMALWPEEAPPGKELPCLLDPGAQINPVEHIRFEQCLTTPGQPTHLGPVQWFARPRNGSMWGNWTIDVCGLNDFNLLELRHDHIEHVVRPQTNAMIEAISATDEPRVRREFQRARGMLTPQNVYVALTYDALCHLIPDAKLAQWNLSWPEPKDVGL